MISGVAGAAGTMGTAISGAPGVSARQTVLLEPQYKPDQQIPLFTS